MGILTPITGLMTIPEYGSRIQLLTMSHIDSQKAGHSSAPYELQTHFPRCTRMRGLLSSCWRIFWTHIGFFTIHPGWTGALLLAHPGKLGMESNEDTCYQKNVTFQEGIPIAPLIHPEDYYNSHAWTRWWPTKKKLYNPSANISTILGIVKWTINQLTYLGGATLKSWDDSPLGHQRWCWPLDPLVGRLSRNFSGISPIIKRGILNLLKVSQQKSDTQFLIDSMIP
jgi:hypothetical protein